MLKFLSLNASSANLFRFARPVIIPEPGTTNWTSSAQKLAAFTASRAFMAACHWSSVARMAASSFAGSAAGLAGSAAGCAHAARNNIGTGTAAIVAVDVHCVRHHDGPSLVLGVE